MLQFILPAILGGGIAALRGGDIRDIGLGAALGGLTGGITSGIESLLGSGVSGATTGAASSSSGATTMAASSPTGYFQGLPALTPYTPPPPGTITPETLTMPDFGRSASFLGGSQPSLDINTDITAGLGQPSHSKMDEFLKSDVFRGMMAALAAAGGGRQREQMPKLPPISVGRLGQPIVQLPSIFPR